MQYCYNHSILMIILCMIAGVLMMDSHVEGAGPPHRDHVDLEQFARDVKDHDGHLSLITKHGRRFVADVLVCGEKITDSWVVDLSRHPHLTQLTLIDTSTTKMGLQVLAENNHRLQRLALQSNSLTAVDLAVLPLMKSVTSLSLQMPKASKGLFPILRKCERLESLSLLDCPIGDDEISGVANCEQLESLSLRSSSLSDASLPVFARLPHLRFLELIGSQVTKDGVSRLKKVKPSLLVTVRDE